MAKASVANILEAINKDLNKDYAKFANELLALIKQEKGEQVKEILNTIASDLYVMDEGYYELSDQDIKELADKYGVEVEE